MEKVFKPLQKKNTVIWSLILIAIIDVPLLLIFFFGLQGTPSLMLFISLILIIVDGLVITLGFLGKKITYTLGENEFKINLGLSKRKMLYSIIKNVKLIKTTLLIRLFGASWPGLHWGLYKAKDAGKIWVYSTTMKGDFVLIELIDGKKIAISPEDPESFLNEINTRKDRFGTSNPNAIQTLNKVTKTVYLQIAAVAVAFFVFLGYLLWIYPTLPEIIPMHFDLNWNPNRWAHKSELFLLGGVAAIFPVINTILVIKFGKYGKGLTIFLGMTFILVMILFFGIVYFIQNII